MGCTIRYEYGLFRQRIVDGYQVEVPDNWLEDGNIWEICRPHEVEQIQFGGRLEEYFDNSKRKFRLIDATTIEDSARLHSRHGTVSSSDYQDRK